MHMGKNAVQFDVQFIGRLSSGRGMLRRAYTMIKDPCVQRPMHCCSGEYVPYDITYRSHLETCHK